MIFFAGRWLGLFGAIFLSWVFLLCLFFFLKQVYWENHSNAAWGRDCQVGLWVLKLGFVVSHYTGGKILFKQKKTQQLIAVLSVVFRPLGPENLLLRGARLKNTREIFGRFFLLLLLHISFSVLKYFCLFWVMTVLWVFFKASVNHV